MVLEGEKASRSELWEEFQIPGLQEVGREDNLVKA